MMKFFFTLSFFIISTCCFSQSSINSGYNLSAEIGRNMHGTGDIMGFQYGLRLNKYLNKTFDLIIAFEGNLNDSEASSFIWEDPDGNEYNSTLHDVIAGFQLNIGIGLNIVNSNNHKFGINPSIFGRYQANSKMGTQITDYPILTGYPVPIRYLIREEPGRVQTIGGQFRIFYNYKIYSKYFIGINSGFQTDSNEDTILFGTLSFGIHI